MLKYPKVHTLMIAAVCLTAVSHGQKSQHATDCKRPFRPYINNQQDESQSPKGKPDPCEKSIQPVQAGVVATPGKDAYDKAGVWINGFLGLMGLGGITVAVCTLRTVNRQTTATEKAASAALLSATAVINAERPWIVVRLVLDPEDLHKYTILGDNAGRTPARIVTIWGDIITAGSNDVFPEVYPYGIGGGLRLHPRLFPPTTTDRIIDIQFTYPTDIKPVPSETMVFILGRIVYADALQSADNPDVLHETRWCYPLTPPGWNISTIGIPPSKYNDYT